MSSARDWRPDAAPQQRPHPVRDELTPDEPMGSVDPALGADLGGTTSHHRASFSDPIGAAPELELRSSALEAGAEPPSEPSSAPEWMAHPSDRTGTGADAEAHGRADVRRQREREDDTTRR